MDLCDLMLEAAVAIWGRLGALLLSPAHLWFQMQLSWSVPTPNTGDSAALPQGFLWSLRSSPAPLKSQPGSVKEQTPLEQAQRIVNKCQWEMVSLSSRLHPSGRQFWDAFCMVSQNVYLRIGPQLPTVKISTMTSHLLASLPSPHHTSYSLISTFWIY
jgi:hypothetical protein